MSWITSSLMQWFRNREPPLSEAEETVLAAGGTWFESEFFSGNPSWMRILETPATPLTEAERHFLSHEVEQFCALLDDWKIVHDDQDLSPEAWQYIKTHRLWGLEIPVVYGGLGFSPMAHSTIIAKIATRSVTAAITVMVPNALGPAMFLMLYGTEEQKRRWLPQLATGQVIGCFALTAVDAGSDACGLIDRGEVVYDTYEGERVLGVRLTFAKRYITLAPLADLIGLAFKLYDPSHLLGSQSSLGMTCALIPAKLPGITIGARHCPMNIGLMNGPIYGDNVFIPLSFLIGEQAGCGQGWRMMVECLSIGRGISLPSLGAAGSVYCARLTAAYAALRQQFGVPIGEFEGVKQALARIGGLAYLAESTRLCTAEAVCQGARPAIASAIAKYHITEFARQSINHAMDIHGGRGIQMGPRNYLASLYHAAPVSITVEGANILTRNLIIFGQGVVRGHPYLQAELHAVRGEDELSQHAFLTAFKGHVRFALCQMGRTLWHGLTDAHFLPLFPMKPAAERLRPFMRQFSRMSAALACMTDITLLVLGAELKRREALSARLGDVLSYLYLGSAVMRRWYQADAPSLEWPFVEWSLRYCLAQIQTAWNGAFRNYPIKLLRGLLRWWVFPWGNRYGLPRDELSFHVAELLQRDADVRNRIAGYCYCGDNTAAGGCFPGMVRGNAVLEKVKCIAESGTPWFFARTRVCGSCLRLVFGARWQKTLGSHGYLSRYDAGG